MAPFSGTPKAQAQSLPRLRRADLVTEAAAGGPFPPSDVLWPLGPGCKAQAGRTQRWPLSFLLCLSPGTSPGRGRAVTASRITQALAQRLPAAPNDAEPQARGRPPWSQLRYSPSLSTGLPLSHHNHACAFSSSRFSTTRPPRSTPMKEVSKRPFYGGLREGLPRRKAKLFCGKWGGGKIAKFRSAGNIRATSGAPHSEACRVTLLFRNCSHAEMHGERQSGERCRGLSCLPV